MRKMQAAAVLALATLALAACGDSNSENSTALDDTNAQSVGAAVALQIASVPATFTATDLVGGGAVGGFFAPRALAAARWAGFNLAPPQFSGAPCPTVDDVTDADGDGVPDDATYTFTEADCSDGQGFYLKGTIHISDPSPTAVGYSGTYGNFLMHLDLQSNDFLEVKLNGSHGVLGTSASGTLSENLTTTLNAKSGNQNLHATISNNWQITFTAAQGEELVMDGLLPNGSFDVDGTFHYDVNGQRFNLAINTQSALVFDAACGDSSYPFSSGELRAHAGNSNGDTYVQVVFTGCGQQPTITFFGGNNT